MAALCSKKFNSYWLDLRPFTQHYDKLHLILGTFLSNISGVDFVNNADQWLKTVINELPEGSLVILNDVPANGKNDQFDELIIMFTNTISNSNVRLLTTSNHTISGTFSEKIDEDNVIEYTDLEFDEDELGEYLTNSGAPDEVIKFSSLISAVTKNNPRLVSAVIQALKDISWGSNSTEVFDVLLEKKFGNKVFETVQSSIKELISDQESKELLYRLSLINWTMELNEIQVIAAVPEPIKYPNEKLSDLNNIWIQQIDGSKYQISPLIDQIGKQNLTEKVIKAVYFNVARSLMKGKIDQIGASRVITLFISANEVNQAGIILVNFLQSARSIQEAQIVDQWGYLHYWTSTSFPAAMDLFLRAHIIYEQIRLKSLLGKDTSRSFSNMESILSEKEITKEVEFVVRIFCLTGFHNQIQPSFSGHLEKLLNEIDEVDETYRKLLTAETVGGLLWMLMQQITSYNELSIWLDLIDTAENKLKLDFFSNEIAPTAIAVLSSRVVNLSEFNRPENLSVAEILNRFQKFFQNKNNEVLESTVLKEIVALTFHEGEDKRIEAQKITENAVQRFSSGDAKYLMYENYGKLLKNIDDSDSEVYLEKALSFEYTDHSTYIDTLIYYASIISPKNSEKAVECCFQAVQLAKQRENFEELDYIQVNAELGLAYWLDGRSSESYETFDLVVTYLFDLRDKSDLDEERWVRLFKWTGHALGYISADTRAVDLPQKNRDDGEYVKPYQGFFSFNTKSLMDLYNKIEDPFLFVHMAFFAEGVDRLEEAYEWSQKAFDLSQRNQDSKVFFMVSSISSQYPLLNFKVSETIESVLFFSAITSHLQGSSAEEKHKELEGINISEVLGQKPSENWNIAEQNTITFALTPLFVMVLTSELEEDGLFELKQKSFIDAIRNYIPKASSTLDWEIILDISAKIFKKEISIKELVDRANTFNEQGRQSLQLMCILGIIHLSKNDEEIAQQLINITPYLLKTQSIRESSIRYILYPFIQEIVKKSLKNSFVGERAELEQKIQIIEEIKRRDENCIQLMLQPLIEELQIQILPDRKRWLYDFEEI